MTSMRAFSLAIALGAALAATPALAQDAAANSVYSGDYLMVGAGGLYGPSYEGSDDYRIDPVPVIQGRLLGVGINAKPGGLALDFINDSGNKVTFALGPSARLRSNRAVHIKDPVVAQLGTLRRAIEIGVAGGVSFNRVLNPYDTLSFSVDARWDINGAHRGMAIDPAVSYLTPLSKGIAVLVGADAEWADDKFMDYYFSVSPAGSAASGLPAFQAKGGWRKLGGSALIGFDLDGDLTNGGLAVAAFGSYSRLLNDAARSPIVAIRGSRDQWIGGLGLGFVF
jgi:outer membrane scaffolding protein for murein synthesis (MipA/OmpV family)